MKKLILVQAILFLLACQQSLAFRQDGTMGSLASQIFATLKDNSTPIQSPRRNEVDTQEGITKLAQQIKMAAVNGKAENATAKPQGKLMGARQGASNQSNHNAAAPESKMTKLARSFINIFAASEPQNNTNKTHHHNHTISNNSSPATLVVNNPETKSETNNQVAPPQPAQSDTTNQPAVVETENTVSQPTQDNTTPQPAATETNNTPTSESNSSSSQEDVVVETPQPAQNNATPQPADEANKTEGEVNQTGPITTVQPPRTNVEQEKPVEIPQMTVSGECSNQIKNSFAIVYEFGVHAAAQNIERVKRDYEGLKTITAKLNEVCAKSFSINMKPTALFSNSGVCTIELEEVKNIAMRYSENSSKDTIYFTKTIQDLWYRYDNFIASCFIPPMEEPKKNTTTTTIGIEKTEIPQMGASDECSTQVQNSFAIIYEFGVHAATKNTERVKRDYESLKTITANLNKACAKSFSINMKPKTSPSFNSGVCTNELEEIKNIATRYSENSSKDMIYFAKTIQAFWYRYENFVSSCASPATKESESDIREQLQAKCLLSFAEATSAVNRMSGNLIALDANSAKILVNNLDNKISNINKYCDAKFNINLENTQTHAAQGNCQKDQSLLKSAVEKFSVQSNKDLDSVSQALRQISYLGKQIINDC